MTNTLEYSWQIPVECVFHCRDLQLQFGWLCITLAAEESDVMFRTYTPDQGRWTQLWRFFLEDRSFVESTDCRARTYRGHTVSMHSDTNQLSLINGVPKKFFYPETIGDYIISRQLTNKRSDLRLEPWKTTYGPSFLHMTPVLSSPVKRHACVLSLEERSENWLLTRTTTRSILVK